MIKKLVVAFIILAMVFITVGVVMADDSGSSGGGGSNSGGSSSSSGDSDSGSRSDPSKDYVPVSSDFSSES